MTLSVAEIVRSIDERAPAGTAESWDNVGLLAGDPSWKTPGAVVSIDLTPESIRAAKARGYRLIMNHHPCIFPKSRGLSRVVAGEGGTAGLVFEALREGIAVAAFHTNFDRCALEVVESVAKGLGVKPKGRLLDQGTGSLLKLAVFVPVTHLEPVREALARAGAGHIGNYDRCSFSVAGEGTFRGGEGTDPFLGEPGRLERAQEHRLETIFPRGLQKYVLRALFEAHPYEEVAYDLYPVEQAPSSQGLVRGAGYGFWGDFPAPRSFPEVAQDVRKLFAIDGFLASEPSPARPKRRSNVKIKRIAFVAGKGASFTGAALAAGCDLFVTGEAGYHTALDGMRRGMMVMELGHRESERFYLSTMRGWLIDLGLKVSELNIPTQRIFAAATKRHRA